MKNRNVCKWYNGTSEMKSAYDKGLLDKKWIEEYCWNGGKGCASPPWLCVTGWNCRWKPEKIRV